ncbi:MerR family transcriptional regulator [bacterium]|nr:MerR family transcriptional regulator [bacterium]
MSVIVKKLYYSISEVCEMTQLKQYVLRYWENEFDILQPSKNRSGNRIYTKEDIENILVIKRLLYDEKYTIEGAKKVLSEEGSHTTNQTETDTIQLFQEIKSDIMTIIKELK